MTIISERNDWLKTNYDGKGGILFTPSKPDRFSLNYALWATNLSIQFPYFFFGRKGSMALGNGKMEKKCRDGKMNNMRN